MSNVWRASMPRNERDKFPCFQDGKSCEERYPGCHGKCQRYIDAKAANDERKATVYAKRNEEHAITGMFIKHHLSIKRKKMNER